MKFFVPEVDAAETESLYAALAAFSRSQVPPANQRIYSIEFVHDGEEWTATVGKQLKGFKTRTRRRKGKKVEVPTGISDAATVLAIFAGSPYLVVTDARPIRDVASAWVNPFLAGRPKEVEFFDEE